LSGRKQHYIPQAVLRSFEAARKGVKSQVLVFKKDRAPYLTATDGAAAERDFYSDPSAEGDRTLDDAITEFEGEHLAPILLELRSKSNGDVDGELASVAVVHLAMRTAHLRGTLSKVTSEAIAQLKAITEDADALREFAGLDSLDPNSRFAEVLREDISKMVPPTWPEKDRRALERMIAFRLRERFDDLVAQSEIPIIEGLSMMAASLPGMVPMAHARALSSSLVPQERIDSMQRLRWCIVSVGSVDHHFILPDCVVVARTNASAELRPYAMLSSEDVVLVVMPLSSHQLLIGCDDEPQLDLKAINLQLARCSLEFFVGSRSDEATLTLAAEIGTRASDVKFDLLDDEDVESSEEFVQEVQGSAHLAVRVPFGKVWDPIKRRLAEIAHDTVETTTLARIESITVPARLSAELETVWKRVPSPAEVQACSLGTVELVKPRADLMCRIILPRRLADSLGAKALDNDRLIATRLVKFNLGRAYYFDCLMRRLPMVFEASSLHEWTQRLYGSAIRLGAHFFGGMASTKHESEPLPGGEQLAELAVSIRAGLAGLRDARERSSIHNNVDQLLLEALQAVDLLLTPTAAVCGFLEAKGIEFPPDSEAGTVLKDAGLWEWLRIFHKDLRRHYEKRQRWSSDEDLSQLGGHVERLLWSIGVFVSPLGSRSWIDKVDDERMEAISKLLRS
jgi:hypothetical protein